LRLTYYLTVFVDCVASQEGLDDPALEALAGVRAMAVAVKEVIGLEGVAFGQIDQDEIGVCAGGKAAFGWG